METSNFSPTLKQRRKFESIIENDTKNHQNTSSVNNHNSDLYTGKLHVSINQKVQTLTECTKESTEKSFLKKKKMDFIDSNNLFSFRRNDTTINPTIVKILHYGIVGATIIGTYGLLFRLIYFHQGTLNFMYISDMASHFPEISYFSFCMYVVSFFGQICMYMRHRVLVQFIEDRGENIINKKINNISNISGILTILGLNILGNFPAFGITYLGHFLGAFLYFVGCTSYGIIQTMLTQKMIGTVSDIYIYYIRAIIIALMLISISLLLIPGYIALLQFEGTDRRNWTRNDSGWLLHVISVIAEWVAVLTFSLFMLTFTYEYHHRIRIQSPVVKIIYLDEKKKKKELNSEIVQETIVQ